MTEYKAEAGDNIGVFVFAGYAPATSLVKELVELDEAGYVITDCVQKTNVDGIYAAGLHKKTGIIPQQSIPEAKPEEAPKADTKSVNSALFDEVMLEQLKAVFSRMESPLVLKLYLDARPASEELRGYKKELEKLTDKLSVEISNQSTEAAPCVEVYDLNHFPEIKDRYQVMSVPCLVINDGEKNSSIKHFSTIKLSY